MRRWPAIALVLCACGAPEAASDAGDRADAGARDAAGRDAPGGDAAPDPDGGAVEPDAGLPEIRDDALAAWPWIEQARRAMDHDTLGAAFAAEGWAPPAGSEIYAARIVDGAFGAAYVLMDAGGGAFSEDFWPASTVKVLSSIAALELLHERGFTGAARVTWDSGFSDVARDIVDRAIRVSSNQDYDRTIRIAGFDRLNAEFLDDAHGFPGVVIQRSYAGFPIRDIPGMDIAEGARTDRIEARASTTDYGCGSDGNCASLFELTEAVRRIVLDEELAASERFALDPSDVAAVEDALCGATPSFFAAGVERELGHAASICHKPGWVPWNDCLDHGVIVDPESGDRWLLAVAVPETLGRTDCAPLADVAEHTLRAVRGAGAGMPLQLDAGIAIRAQLDDRGTVAGRRAYTITIDAPGADRVEVYVDRWSIGSADGSTRFSIDYDFMGGGERLLVVRAFAGGSEIGYRAARVMISEP